MCQNDETNAKICFTVALVVCACASPSLRNQALQCSSAIRHHNVHAVGLFFRFSSLVIDGRLLHWMTSKVCLEQMNKDNDVSFGCWAQCKYQFVGKPQCVFSHNVSSCIFCWMDLWCLASSSRLQWWEQKCQEKTMFPWHGRDFNA